ncbi:MAG: triose-phosphate isomerase [Candidatus Peribacteraceae bacterium]|nr:triose-phosphate isomerase [Candidatus Peribacteraceae bacterium]
MNPKRKLLIAGNWKMNPAPAGFDADDSPFRSRKNVDVAVFPTFLDLRRCIDAGIPCGPQFGRPEPTGAFTGDISMAMAAKLGCQYALCGHSDRRQFHHETDEEIAKQFVAAIDNNLIPIFCFGETESEHDAGKTIEVLKRQLQPIITILTGSLSLTADRFSLAYEPVWAISRGDPNKPAATSKDAQEIHALIRSLLPKDKQASTRILYGGSMKGSNAAELLAQPDIDGGLVGGASLKIDDFRKIVEAAEKNGQNNG